MRCVASQSSILFLTPVSGRRAWITSRRAPRRLHDPHARRRSPLHSRLRRKTRQNIHLAHAHAIRRRALRHDQYHRLAVGTVPEELHLLATRISRPRASEGRRALAQPGERPEGLHVKADTFDTIDWLLLRTSPTTTEGRSHGTSYRGWLVAAGMIDAHPGAQSRLAAACVIDTFAGDDWHNGATFSLTLLLLPPHRCDPRSQRQGNPCAQNDTPTATISSCVSARWRLST